MQFVDRWGKRLRRASIAFHAIPGYSADSPGRVFRPHAFPLVRMPKASPTNAQTAMVVPPRGASAYRLNHSKKLNTRIPIKDVGLNR